MIDSIRDRAIFRLAYHAGLRASVIGMLQLRDYDPKAAKIFVHRLKGSNSGHHHLVREEARALRAWLKVRGSFSDPMLLSKQKRPIDRTTLHLLMKKYGAAADIHRLRWWLTAPPLLAQDGDGWASLRWVSPRFSFRRAPLSGISPVRWSQPTASVFHRRHLSALA